MEFVLTGIKGIARKVQALEKANFTEDMLSEIAIMIMGQIKDRTVDGVDVDGRSFTKYSDSYAKWRKKEGYSTSPVDLTFSGHMLSAMTSTSTAKEAKIFFMDTKDTKNVSAPDKAFWNNEDREFFGLSKNDEKLVMRIVDDYYERLISSQT